MPCTFLTLRRLYSAFLARYSVSVYSFHAIIYQRLFILPIRNLFQRFSADSIEAGIFGTLQLYDNPNLIILHFHRAVAIARS